ncbi:Cytochrome P450 [Metarhizium album ARSEF 1941]|uniref:Cytochrome P450 n=1 Tax=Metarhizium album (strain ARSEF 1941) TaxID=1081103 RepID=A0A0B2WFY4_METAS|nr:Cytochrome P450 [Metarhizium album ARSEF 1941]KHN94886.1 Cytochrome P450 [Metarhizium album ARSEF 1941]
MDASAMPVFGSRLNAVTAIALGLLSIFVVSVVQQYLCWRRMPPGPRPLPLMGNIHQIPRSYPWRGYADMFKRYGPLVTMQFGPQKAVMIGSVEVARDLLDKRNSIYSSRPRVPMIQECISRNFRILFLPYGCQWRTYHKLHASVLNVRVSDAYRPLHDLESRQLLLDLSEADAGERFAFHFFRYSASLIYSLAYGIRLPKGDEPEVKVAYQVMEELSQVLLQTWAVDILPWINVLPRVLAPWKRIADRMHDFESSFLGGLAASAQQKPGWNWSKNMLTMKESKNMSRTELGYILGVLYEAGSDTTAIALSVFVMAMILYPGVARKAQRELDQVVGPDRMPTFDDLDRLPYIHAIVKETLRWRPVIPGGIPHAVTEDDEYKGYHIPKGSMIIPNLWAMAMDERLFKQAERFIPERWIENPALPLFPFGFGRRVCPGQHVGKNSLLINTARMLWAYDFEHAYEVRDGVKVQCPVDAMAFTNAFNSQPLPFKAAIIQRSGNVREVMQREWDLTEKDHLVHLEHLQAKMENMARHNDQAAEDK